MQYLALLVRIAVNQDPTCASVESLAYLNMHLAPISIGHERNCLSNYGQVRLGWPFRRGQLVQIEIHSKPSVRSGNV